MAQFAYKHVLERHVRTQHEQQKSNAINKRKLTIDELCGTIKQPSKQQRINELTNNSHSNDADHPLSLIISPPSDDDNDPHASLSDIESHAEFQSHQQRIDDLDDE